MAKRITCHGLIVHIPFMSAGPQFEALTDMSHLYARPFRAITSL